LFAENQTYQRSGLLRKPLREAKRFSAAKLLNEVNISDELIKKFDKPIQIPLESLWSMLSTKFFP
jgi:hypothetical protein